MNDDDIVSGECGVITTITPKPTCPNKFKAHINNKTGVCVPEGATDGDFIVVKKDYVKDGVTHPLVWLCTKYGNEFYSTATQRVGDELLTLKPDCTIEVKQIFDDVQAYWVDVPFNSNGYTLNKGSDSEYGETAGERSKTAEWVIPKDGVYNIQLDCVVYSPDTEEGKGIYYLYVDGEEVEFSATNDSRSEVIREGGTGITIDGSGSTSYIKVLTEGQKIESYVSYHNQGDINSSTYGAKCRMTAHRIGYN